MAFYGPTSIISLAWTLNIIFSQTTNGTKCIPRNFGYNSFVCVCNSDYCDTVDQLPEKINEDEYHVYTTSKDKFRLSKSTHRFKDQRPSVSYGSEQCGSWFSGSAICVDTTQLKQTLLGFGGSFTDAVGQNLENLTPDTRQRLMESYFTTKGIEYTIGRVPIGGCDFSMRPYSLDETVNDFGLQDFSLADEDYRYKIPLIKEAQQMSSQAIKLVGSAWSAPTWMKYNGKLNGGGSFLKGLPGGKYYQAYADYHIRFLEEYSKSDIHFWGITSQNEPMDGFIPFFPFNCMGFLPYMLRVFVNENLGPALEKAGFSNVKLFVLDDNRPLLIPYMSTMMLDPRSQQYVSGAALHWYMDNLVSPHVLDWVHKTYPDKLLLMTEASFLHYPGSGKPVQLGNWNRASDYAYSMIDNLNHWVNGWVDWNLALDPDGGPNWANFNLEGTIIVNKTSDEFYKQPIYYILGHFTKFVPPESKVIEVYITPMAAKRGISAVAFITPRSTTVLVVLNRNSRDISVNIFVLNIGQISTIIGRDSIQTYILHR